MKSLFFGMLALAAMTSCSNNDDEAAVVDSGTKAVSISLDYGTATRAIGDPETAGAPALTNVHVEFLSTIDGTGPVSQVLELTTAQLGILNGAAPGAKVIAVTAPASANSIRMVANNGATSLVSKSIVDYQGKSVKTTIPYEGIGKIIPTDVKLKKYTAAIALDPIVARVEVSGIIKPASLKWTVAVTGVYANNFLTTLRTPSLFTLQGAGGALSNTPLAGMFDKIATPVTTDWTNAFKEVATKCAAYQMFAGSYGLTLQVEGTKTGSPKRTEFIVIKSFNQADGKAIANLEAGKIYKLDLTKTGLGAMFTDTEDPMDPTPDGAKSVDVSVNVMQWTVENVTPNL